MSLQQFNQYQYQFYIPPILPAEDIDQPAQQDGEPFLDYPVPKSTYDVLPGPDLVLQANLLGSPQNPFADDNQYESYQELLNYSADKEFFDYLDGVRNQNDSESSDDNDIFLPDGIIMSKN